MCVCRRSASYRHSLVRVSEVSEPYPVLGPRHPRAPCKDAREEEAEEEPGPGLAAEPLEETEALDLATLTSDRGFGIRTSDGRWRV